MTCIFEGQSPITRPFPTKTRGPIWVLGIYIYIHRSESRWRNPSKGDLVRGHDKPRLMGVAIAIDPFQVVYMCVCFFLLKLFLFNKNY